MRNVLLFLQTAVTALLYALALGIGGFLMCATTLVLWRALQRLHELLSQGGSR